jgi:hypothetical protein
MSIKRTSSDTISLDIVGDLTTDERKIDSNKINEILNRTGTDLQLKTGDIRKNVDILVKIRINPSSFAVISSIILIDQCPTF